MLTKQIFKKNALEFSKTSLYMNAMQNLHKSIKDLVSYGGNRQWAEGCCNNLFSLILQSDALKQLQHILHSLPKEIAAIILFQEGSKKEGNVLFNDALNTFYLRLYGIRHMAKDHSDSERKPAAAT